MNRDFARRESALVIPSMDSVLDAYGQGGGPMDRRDQSFTFRVFTADLDAAYDLLAAQVVHGAPVRLRYLTDTGGEWLTIAYNAKIQHTLTSSSHWGTGGVAEFTVIFRIRPYWTQRFSHASDVWGYNDGVWGASDGTWGGAGIVPLSAASVNFNLDNTGTAGFDLPTLPTTGLTLTITGGTDGFGGTGGILIVNGSAFRRDPSGALVAYNLTVPQVPPGAEMVIDTGKQRFTLSGVPFRPVKDPWQREWFIVEAGIVNGCSITALGSSQLFGSSAALLADYFKRRA